MEGKVAPAGIFDRARFHKYLGDIRRLARAKDWTGEARGKPSTAEAMAAVDDEQ